MKKIIGIMIISSCILTSCVAKRELISTVSQNLKYRVLPEANTTVATGRVWILFIPIGFGPRKYTTRKEKAMHGFLKQNKADAILNGEIVDRKVIIPLILINISSHWTKVTGKPGVLEVDSLTN